MMNSILKLPIDRWKIALSDKKFVIAFFSIITLFIFLMYFVSIFQSVMEYRQGAIFIDPLFGNVPPLAFNAIIFIAIYTSQAIALVLALAKPEKTLQILLGYFFVYFFRIFATYLLPLEPPAGIIPLIDPLLIWFGDGQIILKDLFYSGHTSTTLVVILITENRHKFAKLLMIIGLIVVMIGILIQRVHYSIDVYAAIFYAYASYRSTIFVLKKLKFINYSV